MRLRSISVLLVSAASFWSGDALRAKDYVYVSAAAQERISVYELEPKSGAMAHRTFQRTDGEPGALCVGPGRRYLFASIRSKGRLASFAVDPIRGDLRPVSDIAADADPAYVTTDAKGRYLLSAYYRAGKVAVHPIGPEGALEEKTARWIDTAEKAHAVVLDTPNRFVFVPHTGPNRIYRFRFDARTGALEAMDPPFVSTPERSGPRQGWIHPSEPFAFFANEQGSSVTSYAFDRESGRLTAKETLSTLPRGFSEPNSCARLVAHPTGRFIYVANRGHDSIAAFAVHPESGEMRFLGAFPTEKTPRGFDLAGDGRFLIAAGQSSHRLAVYRIQATGKLERTGTVAAGLKPWWVLAVRFPNAQR